MTGQFAIMEPLVVDIAENGFAANTKSKYGIDTGAIELWRKAGQALWNDRSS